MNNLFANAQFLKTVVRLTDLPSPEGKEVAFLGRSNVGKSSTLNAIVNQRSLARTSRTPGRTQAINMFTLNPNTLKLIDLPGYGFAKAPPSVVKEWHKLIDGYLRERECLAGLILIMDIRHPLQDMDQAMFDWLLVSEIPVHLVLNKCDKLSRMQGLHALKKLQLALAQHENISLQLFSASKKIGLLELQQKVAGWLLSN